MKETHFLEFSLQELQLIKAALLNIDEKSPYYEQAQAMADVITLEALPLDKLAPSRRQAGTLQDKIIEAVTALGLATAKQISEATEIDVNAVNSLVSKLYKKKILDKQMIPNPNFGQGRGNRYKSVAAYSIYKPESTINKLV